MSNNLLVHVLVINWNGREHLHDCFESLLSVSYSNVRFILLDNASDDDSVQFVQNTFGHDKRVGFIECPTNLGWSGANNAGMLAAIEANARYVLLLNNDTRVEPEFLSLLVTHAEDDETVGALSPRLLMFDEPTVINSLGLESSIIGAGWDKGIGQQSVDIPNKKESILGVCGAAMFIRCEALAQSGLLPEDFGIYLDDLDLSMRIWGAGYSIERCDSSVVYHKFSATMGKGASARQKYYLNTRNRSRIVLRNFPLSKLPVSFIASIVGEIRSIGSSMRDGEWWKIPIHIRAWGATLLYLPYAVYYRRSNGGLKQAHRYWPMIKRRPLFFQGMPSRNKTSTHDAH